MAGNALVLDVDAGFQVANFLLQLLVAGVELVDIRGALELQLGRLGQSFLARRPEGAFLLGFGGDVPGVLLVPGAVVLDHLAVVLHVVVVHGFVDDGVVDLTGLRRVVLVGLAHIHADDMQVRVGLQVLHEDDELPTHLVVEFMVASDLGLTLELNGVGGVNIEGSSASGFALVLSVRHRELAAGRGNGVQGSGGGSQGSGVGSVSTNVVGDHAGKNES